MALHPYREPDTIRCPMCAKIGVCVSYTPHHVDTTEGCAVTAALVLRCGRCDFQIGAMQTAPEPDTRTDRYIL